MLAFAIGLPSWRAAAAARSRAARPLRRACRSRCWRSAPSTRTAFPGWPGSPGALGVWAAVELAARRGPAPRRPARLLRLAAPTALVGIGVLRRRHRCPSSGGWPTSRSFETFDPDGAGLGNLFDRISPLEALGIWPSGDFRVEPGDGAAPAIVFYLGAAFGLAALGFGLAWWCAAASARCRRRSARRRVLWLYALRRRHPVSGGEGAGDRRAAGGAGLGPGAARRRRRGWSALAFVARGRRLQRARARQRAGRPERVLAASCASWRPSSAADRCWSPLRPELLDDQHGRDYLVWELRGNRVCVGADGRGAAPPA